MSAVQGSLLAAMLCVITAFGDDGSAERQATIAALMREGIAAHDQHRYSDAIKKYAEVLAGDPQNVRAWYEMSYSQMSNGDAAGCIDSASEGLKYKSDMQGQLYALLGSCQDLAGQPKEAIATLKQGIKRAPREAMLHFNLGVTYSNTGELEAARKYLRESVRLRPMHAGSNLALAAVYRKLQYRIPSLLAALMFLCTEPASNRSAQGIEIVQAALGGLATKGEGEGAVNINLTANPKNDEGDFTGTEMMLAISIAPVGKERQATDFERLANAVSLVGTTLSTAKCKGSAFACKHYGPFFSSLAHAELTDALLDRAFRSAKITGKDEWETAHPGKMDEFAKWIGEYKWLDD